MLRAVPVAALIAIGCAGLFFAANYESLGRGGQYRIPEAFASGALQRENYLRGDTVRGYHQYNDCLILSMAVAQDQPKRSLAISPTVPADNPDICTSFRKDDPRIFYHNYLHGQVTLVRYLLPRFSVEQVRNLYHLVISLALGVGIALAMLRLSRRELIERNVVAVIVLFSFVCCFGLETFGQSLGHGPSDFILISFTAYFALARGLSARRATIVAAIFGSLTMIFELLTGGLPLGLAATFGLTGLRSLKTAILAASAFATAAVVTYAIKVAAVAYTFGSVGYLREIGTRTIGAVPTDSNAQSLLGAILGNTEAMMPGLGPLAGILLLIAISAGVGVLIDHPSTRIRLLAISNAPIFLWPLVFRQHMIVHAAFMDRIFVWTIASGFSMFFLALGPHNHDAVERAVADPGMIGPGAA